MEDCRFIDLCQHVMDVVEEICTEHDGQWIKRKRNTTSLLMVMLILYLSKNHQAYGTTIITNWSAIQDSIPRLRHLKPIAASSFCEARSKFDEAIFKKINDAVIYRYNAGSENLQLWFGHRIFTIDGTKINLPRELLEEGFKLPSSMAHYPQGLVSTLYNIKTKMPHDIVLEKLLSERRLVASHLDQLKASDVVVYDRGYFSYEVIREHVKRQIHAIFRLKENGNMSRIQMFLEKSRALESVVTIKPNDRWERRIKKTPARK